MSDTAPKRQIAGLDMLVRSRRPEVVEIPDPPAEAQPAAPETPPAEKPAATRPQAGKDARSGPPRPKGGTTAPRPQRAAQRLAEDSPRDRVSAYVSSDTANRAKNAFRATGHLEGDASFSEFIETAIVRELERRERAHNAGEPYPTDSGKLSAGRPLGS